MWYCLSIFAFSTEGQVPHVAHACGRPYAFILLDRSYDGQVSYTTMYGTGELTVCSLESSLAPTNSGLKCGNTCTLCTFTAFYVEEILE